MLYLIGLGLNENGISKEGLLALERCKKVYLEGYTVELPYKIDELKLGKKKKKIIRLGRKEVESDRLIKEAKSVDVALLVYGSPLFATTHMSLVLDAEKAGVKVKVVHSASVLDAVAETGLQLYKFGKIASMPKEKADFMLYVNENKKIGAHSLILVDIGLSFEKALGRLKVKDKIVVCSRLGNEEGKIIYANIDDLKEEEIKQPFCFIIPGKLHFMEKEALEKFKRKSSRE